MTTNETFRLLTIFHTVLGAVLGILSLLPLIHVTVGALLVVLGPSADVSTEEQQLFQLVGGVMLVAGAMFVLFGLTLSACIGFAAYFISNRRNYTFCLVVAGVECLFMPIGTALGVFTIYSLLRDEIRLQFAEYQAGGNIG